ncbi:MAG: hypothetical protein K9J12_11935 [Melioribacteraceae bacterium]|nr:hypothetical protein [Melioribacteraceae bacterium]MCF8262891.1 hypothetical protein [Melioribacteraceae bacterium]MCF8430913.1 hypothetical protein [Melioribacteraceae bacterium]
MLENRNIKIDSIILTDDNHLLEFDITINSEKHHIFFRSNNAKLTPSPEAFVSLLLHPAMKTKKHIHLEEEIDGKFLDNLPTIQSIYSQWHPHLQLSETVQKNLRRSKSLNKKRERTALFYSGGVDANFSLLKLKDEIDDLILIRGFDINLENSDLLNRTSELAREIGKRYDKRVIEIETNVVQFLKRYRKLIHFFSAVLSSIGHILSSEIGRVIISSAENYASLTNNIGTHAVLEPRWSSDSLDVIYYGCKASRLQKLDFISRDEFILNYLRVCGANNKSALNCGECEKCVRTMTGLLSLNKLDVCNSFEKKLDVRNIYPIRMDPFKSYVYSEILYELEKRGTHRDVCFALSTIINRPNFITTNKTLLKNVFQRQKYRFPKLYNLILQK